MWVAKELDTNPETWWVYRQTKSSPYIFGTKDNMELVAKLLNERDEEIETLKRLYMKHYD